MGCRGFSSAGRWSRSLVRYGAWVWVLSASAASRLEHKSYHSCPLFDRTFAPEGGFRGSAVPTSAMHRNVQRRSTLGIIVSGVTD